MVQILITGVGGQGTLVASKVLGALAQALGQDVKVSEVHGMAQRGGSVVTHVKFGDRVFSSLVEPGEADAVMAFEQLEALRYRDYLKPDGLIAVNTQRIMPITVLIGAGEYPENIIDTLQQNHKVRAVDALALAREAGSERAVNMVMMGVLSTAFDIPEEKWQEAIANTVPASTVPANLKAFELGRKQ